MVSDNGETRFPIRFSGPNRSMAIVGLSPGRSWIGISESEITVRMAWAFHLVAPLSAIGAASPDTGRVMGWGVHGWRGAWLVNGSSEGIVKIEFDPPVRARAVGVKTSVATLRVSVEDPDGLIAALS